MAVFPKIPTRIECFGNVSVARKFAGLGQKRYSDLVTAMGFQKLKIGFNTLELNNGVFIRTSHNYGISKIEIYAPLIEQSGEEVVDSYSCPCYPHLTLGYIVDVTPDRELTEQEAIEGLRYKYTVNCCGGTISNEDSLAGIYNAKTASSSGWERYYEGQYVLLTSRKALDFRPDDDCIYRFINDGSDPGDLEILPIYVTEDTLRIFTVR